MCLKCTFVQQDPPRWTCIGNVHYRKLCRECTPGDAECKEWASVQHHGYCFDASHATPTPWDKCGHKRWHVNDALLIIHPDKSASLPEPFSKEAFARKVRVDTRLEKPFPADEECRSQNTSVPNREFLRLGYSSTMVDFSPDQKERLKVFLDGVAGSKNMSGRQGGKYNDGRIGTPIPKSALIGLDSGLLEAILSPSIISAIKFYFGSSKSPVLYDAENLRTLPRAGEQRAHADISPGGIKRKNLKVNLSRLSLVIIYSPDGPGTTLVYPNTRTDSTFADERKQSIRITDVNNVVMFDGRMGHKGAQNNSDNETRRLVLVFQHPDATKEQLEVMYLCLKRRSFNLSVTQLLAGPMIELPMPKKRSSTEDRQSMSENTRCLRSSQHATRP
jgi:hypothetical protein